MSHREPHYIPDSLPLHFRLDVACLRLGAAEGPHARADVRIIPQRLESEWRRLRCRQEQNWATRPADDMHFELHRAAAIHHANIKKIHERLTSGSRGMLRECVRVLRLQLGPKRELTDADMENFSGRLSIEAIVDLGGDPLMADLNFINEGRSTIFKLLFEVYERYLIQAPDDPTSPRYELRMAHTAHYDYVLLFPPRPYTKCTLREPEKHQCVSAAFPVDTNVLEAMYHQEKILVAHATLTFLFWECFNAIFPKDMSPWEKEESVHFEKLRRSKVQRLRDCTSREDAMGILWSIMSPSDFRLPFHCTLSVRENTAGGLIEAVQVALHDAAQELECEHSELMPLAWTTVPSKREDLQWPLIVQHVASEGSEPTAALPLSEFPGLHQVKPIVAVSGELATLEYSAILRCEFQDMDTDEEARETIEDKDVIAVLDLAQVVDKGEITVMQMTGTGHMEIQLALEVMAQLEECLIERGRWWLTKSSGQVQDLSVKASQVAFGLRALQRASIKQQLRDVGLTVIETVRPVQQQEEDTSLGGCCSTVCALCGLHFCCCCRRKQVAAKVAADVEREMRRLMFISAPDLVLQQRAEMHKMILKVCPNRFQTFIGGFKPSQFMRSAPTQPFWVEIPTDPYPYHPYFAPSLPAADPASIFSPAERKILVRSFITDPLSEIRFPDGCVDPRQGGADIDLSELVSEDILDGFLCLGSTLLGNHLVDSWILRWRHVGLVRFMMSSHFRLPSKTLLRNYGPQIASYFEFLAFVAKALVIAPAPLGCFAWYAGLPNAEADGSHPFWKYVQPIFGLCMVLWSVIFCVMWRRQAAYLGYLWNNGLTRIGEELQSGSSLFSRQKDLRVEFAMHFRKNFDRASSQKQARILNSLRKVLHVPPGLDYGSSGNNNNIRSISNILEVTNERSAPSNVGLPSVAAFGNKQLRSDIDSHIEACYVPIWERRRRMLAGDFVTFVFVGLSSSITLLSLTLQNMLEDERKKFSIIVSYIVSGVTSGLLIPLLNVVHRRAALSFTEWESYRKKRDHEASIFYKLFAFDFFNYFNGLFWIAFFYQNMEQLRVQVASIMITMCLWGNWREVVLPLIWKRLRRADTLPASRTTAEIHHDGPLGRALRQVGDQWTRSDDFILVDEVIELVLQFGMATMFAVAFPLGPLVLLVSCILELRIDAYKLIRLLRVPEPYMSVGIGVPYHAFLLIALVSLFVNCAIMSLTKYGGDENVKKGTGLEVLFPNESFKTRVFFAVALEHVLLAIIYIILSWTPILSTHVREDEFRQQYYEMREDMEYRRDEEDATSAKSMQAQRSRRRRQAARPAARTPVCSPREIALGETSLGSQLQGSQFAVREKHFKVAADLEENFLPVTTTTVLKVSTAPVAPFVGGTDNDAHLDPGTDF